MRAYRWAYCRAAAPALRWLRLQGDVATFGLFRGNTNAAASGDSCGYRECKGGARDIGLVYAVGATG